MSEILDRSLKVIFKDKTYILNFTMKNMLQYEKNVGNGIFKDINEFFSFKINPLIDLIACMLEDENGTILSDFVYGLSDDDKMRLVNVLNIPALNCFSENLWGKDDREITEDDKKKE